MSDLPKKISRVALRRGGDPASMAFDALREALNPDELANKLVLIKPNCCYPTQGGSGVVTHPETVRGVVRFCREAGAASVWIGDGAIYGLDTDQALEMSGMAAVARQEGARLVNLERAEAVTLDPPDPMVLERIRVSSLALEAEAIISVPVMKCHMHVVASLGIKNMKGCLYGQQKRDFHHLREKERFARWREYKTIDRAIADLFSLLPPQVVVTDGVVGLEGLGPLLGDPKPLRLVLASKDPLSADWAAAALMGLTPQEIPHLALAAHKSGRPLVPWQELDLDQRAFEAAISPFQRAQAKDLSRRFPQFKVQEGTVCSACPATVTAFLLTYGDKYAQHPPVLIAMGRGLDPAEVPEGSVLMGNCTAKAGDKGYFIEGCPPVPSDLVRAIAALDKKKP